MNRKQRVCILGVGSPFGADAVGMDAVDQLRARSVFSGCVMDLSFKQIDRPGLSLLDEIRGADVAIIIDAMQAGFPPGTLRCIELGELLEQSGNISVHEFGVAQAIALGQALGDLPPTLVLIGIEIGLTQTTIPFDLPALEKLVDGVIKKAARV